MVRTLLLALLLFPFSASAGVDGHKKLPTGISPLLYTVDLTIDPAQPTFSGTVAIELQLDAPRRDILLHGEGFTYEDVSLTLGNTTLTGMAEEGDNGGLRLTFGEELPAGPATLSLRFTGPLDEIPDGLYRVEEGGAWYAFTQFEPLDAREAFPCFDEPRFKTPYRVTLRVPEALIAAANGPTLEGRSEDGWSITTFAETRPLPTYLVAFAVGDFDIVEGQPGTTSIPFRVLTPKGKGELAAYTIEHTPALLKALEDYFGQPYPFAKLDFVAVPNFSAGAMENVGLVTYRERLLLIPPNAPPRSQSAHQGVVAHELAHMWFGNLVTPAWWDELWLNESFATWMATKIVAQVSPELEADLGAVSRSVGVMSYDAQKETRAIRQPIRHGGDVLNAFDPITYGKGASILRMIEAWTGEEKFRNGVRAYMAKHAEGNATNADLQVALEAATRLPIGDTMRRFLDQPGAPLITLDWTCADHKLDLTLAQERFLPTGSDAPQGKPWRVPLCLRMVQADGTASKQCLLLEQPKQQISWNVGSCPAFIHPNADEQGYYHWLLPRDQLMALVTTHRDKLSLPERIGLYGHLSALLEAGHLPAEDLLSVLEPLSAETHRMIVSNVISGIGTLHRVGVTDANRPQFEAFVQRLLRPHADRLGLDPQPDEPATLTRLRPSVLNTLAVHGADEALRKRAEELTARYLEDPAALTPDQLTQYVPLAANWGDAELWEALRAALDERASDPLQRSALISALARFRDPDLLQRSLALALDGTLRAQDFWSIAGASLGREETRPITWRWATENYNAIVELRGPSSARSMPWLGSNFCDLESRAEVEAFFTDPEHTGAGSERNLALALESIDRCIRLRELSEDAMHRFLDAQKQP